MVDAPSIGRIVHYIEALPGSPRFVRAAIVIGIYKHIPPVGSNGPHGGHANTIGEVAGSLYVDLQVFTPERAHIARCVPFSDTQEPLTWCWPRRA